MGKDKVLIVHENPGDILQTLEKTFPGAEFLICGTEASLLSEGVDFRPNIVFTFHVKDISKQAHRQIVLLPTIEWIHVGGAGFDYLQPLDGLDVTVTNSSGVLREFMAESVITGVLMLNRRMHDFMRFQRERSWQKPPWRTVRGKTALVIGLGAIGEAVCAQLHHFGLHVIGMRSSKTKVDFVDEQITREQLLETLPRADYVCLHVPLTDATRHLIGSAELAAMSPTSMLVNTARGDVVDEMALIDALQSGSIAGAFLDVFSTEPLPEDSPLWTLDNVIITPHNTDEVENWEEIFYQFFIENLTRFQAKEALVNVVDVVRGY